MYYATFLRKSILNKAVVGVVATLLAFASFFATISQARAASLDPVTAVAVAEDPSKTTLAEHDQLIVTLNYQQSFNDLQIDPSGSCTINNKDVKSTFQSFNDGTYQLVYTVAAGDANAAAGQIPFSCAFTDTAGNSGTITGFTNANNLAIAAGGTNTGGDNTGGGDTTGGNNTGGDNTGGTTGQITNATVVATPSSGTLGIGQTLVVDINQLDHMADLTTVDGFCKINNVEVTDLVNLGNGHYTVSHTYTAQDADILPGLLTFTCNVKNAAGQTGTLHFTSPNTVSIDTQPDTNGLPPAGTFQVTLEPSTGTANVGDTVLVRVNDSGGITDFAVDPTGSCTVNGKDVKNSFQAFGDHTYQLVYTVAAGDSNVAAGNLSVSCNVKNPAGTTGTIHTVSSNTLAINGGSTGGDNTGGNNTGGDNTGGNNTGGDNTGGNTTPIAATVTAVPSTGTLGVGQTLEVHIHQTNNQEDLVLNGACTVNGRNVNNFENLHNGDYKVTYTVEGTDANATAGHVVFSCPVKNGAGTTATLAFTDNNTVAVNVGGNNTGGNNTGGNTNGSSDTSGDINGNVQGGSNSQDNGVLAVTQIDQIKSVATADGTIESGWKWIFHVTVPSNEPKLQLKFNNWMHTNGVNSISPASNMRISSNEVSGGPVMVTGADTYTAPLTVTGDLNASMPGKQVDVTVEMGVPVGSTNGSYTTTYHVKTSENI